tara:strand:- start:150 stop:341 length:192 start_codon:yes stop_codon:yes gene_type:complete
LLISFHERCFEAYESEEYRELSKLRKEPTENSKFTIMEGLDQAAKLRRAMGILMHISIFLLLT